MDIQACDKLLRTTRSVRKRLDFSKPVEPKVLEECIDIALQAPTGSNMQGWSVVVVTDEDKKKAIADVYKTGFAGYAAMREQAPPAFDDSDLRAEQMGDATPPSTVYDSVHSFLLNNSAGYKAHFNSSLFKALSKVAQEREAEEAEKL